LLLHRSHLRNLDVSAALLTSTAAIALLAEIFPQAFFIYGARRKPLKLGIRDEIVARLDGAVEPPELALALSASTAAALATCAPCVPVQPASTSMATLQNYG
jgi:hypothetical protein